MIPEEGGVGSCSKRGLDGQSLQGVEGGTIIAREG